MKLRTILKSLADPLVSGTDEVEIDGVACDSRQIRPGYLFAAVSGNQQDGWKYVDEAINRGAVAVVSEHAENLRRNITQVQVRDSRLAAATVASTFYGNPSARLHVTGITGTNGKTTTSYMIRDIMRADGRNPGLIGTIEYAIGARSIPATRTTPDAMHLQSLLAQMAGAGCQSAVMEVSSHSLAQKRVHGVEFDVAVFTNLTRDHLDYHGTMEGYFEAKLELFKRLDGQSKQGVAVINVDDPWGNRLAGMDWLRAHVLTCGFGREAMVRAGNVEMSAGGSEFSVWTTWGEVRIRTPLPGRHNVYNAVQAVAACGAAGVELDLMADALRRLSQVPGRLERVGGRNVFVDYAHTDDALENALRTLREITGRRLIVVFGCGGNRDRTKRPAMGAVAAKLADFTILTSDNPRKETPISIIEDILKGYGRKDNVEVIEDRSEAIRKALSMARKDDTVLVAGKGHETYQELANTTIPFDDRKVVEKWL